jgi:hypothetical protein
MGYPTIETIKMFVEITSRDGFEEISENLLLKHKDQRIVPLLSYFKQAIIQMLEGELYDEADGFSSGFIVCLDLFRRQIESEAITLEELEIQLENMCGWSEYLENENVRLKEELSELTRRYTELQKVSPLQSDGDLPNSP